ncbi:MAG TPA: hypothetical protein VFT22_04685 [Kofleriaceae bacterium]|nr:hypothetical protein [Kofleriaceae bacterium]
MNPTGVVQTAGALVSSVAEAEALWTWVLLPPTTAVRATSYELPGLARNAVIRTLDVELTAAPADQTPLAVALIRTNVIRGKLVSIVVDFGTLVTVSGIEVELGSEDEIGVYRVHAWNGSAFAYPFHNTPLVASFVEPADGDFLPAKLAPALPSTAHRTVFATEVRTEKLQIEVVTSLPAGQLPEKLALHLPDAPSGLDLVTETGLRLFNQVATVVRVGTAELNDRDWNQDWKRLVHLAPLLAPLAGDPVAHDALPVTLTLSSRVPGVLEIVESTRDIAWLERLALGPDSARDLTFAEEGQLAFTLPVDSIYKQVDSATLTAVGKPGPARVLPPIGPTPIPELDLVVTPELAMACRVPVAGLASLTGVRLALAAGPEGAELKIVVLDDSAGAPGAPIPGAESAPLTLPAGGAAVAAPWTTFELAKPLDLARTPSPWIAILVSRGKLAWSMGQYADPAAAAAVPVRRGPPSGPWIRLPSMFQRPDGFRDLQGNPFDLTRLGARIRAVGLAPANAPIAPYRFAITATDSPSIDADDGVAVTPTAKGVAISWAGPLAISSHLTVQVVSFVADTLTLRNLDVTLTK